MSNNQFKSKLIHNIHDDTYTQYAGLCKAKRTKIGHAITYLMAEELKKQKKIQEGKTK